MARGDECVSLGWCFWHRACYGCLLCGSKLIGKGVPLAGLFADQESTDDEDLETSTDEEKRVYLGTKKGREIDQIPLCANCMAEVDIDHLDERSVVQKGLRRTDQADGGMSRRRWEGSHWGRDKASGSKEVSSSHQKSGRQRKPHRGSHSRSAYGDGADSESMTENDEPQLRMGYPARAEPSTIYVSMFDPIGRPAFRPSPTKPIPQWMEVTSLPSREYRGDDERPNAALKTSSTIHISTKAGLGLTRVEGRHGNDQGLNTEPVSCDTQWGEPDSHHAGEAPGWDQRTGPVTGQYVGQKLLARPSGHRAGSSRSSYASTICPTKSKLRARIPARAASPAHSTSSNGSASCDTRPLIYKGRSYVIDEPLTLPSSLMPPLDPEDNLSTSTYSTYATPPEYPSPPRSGGRRTPDSSSEAYESHYIPSRSLEMRKRSYASTSNRARGQEVSLEPERPPRSRHSVMHLQTRIPKNSAAGTVPSIDSHASPERQLAGHTPSRAMSYNESLTTRHKEVTASRYPNREAPRDFAVAALGKTARAQPTTALTSDQAGSIPPKNRSPRDQALSPDGGQERPSYIGNSQDARRSNIIGNDSIGTSKRRSVHSELKRLFGR